MKPNEIKELIKEHFDARLCPKTAELFAKKYLLPQHRAVDYPNQDDLNNLNLSQLAFRNSIVYVNPTDLGILMKAARYGRPTMFLERELGELLMESKLPEDLAIDDIIQPQFPALRIILPKGLLAIYHRNYTESIMFIDIAFTQTGEEIRCPASIAKELDENALREFGTIRGPKLSDICITRPNNDAGIEINGTSSVRHISYGVTKPWNQRTLGDLIASYMHLMNADCPPEDDEDMSFKVQHLALNLLILLSSVPAEYEPHHVIRKAQPEGKRIIPALLQPKWVGDVMVRARHAGLVKGETSNKEKGTGRTVASHWVRPHWRRQPYGKGFGLRKLIWILPYQTGTKEDET